MVRPESPLRDAGFRFFFIGEVINVAGTAMSPVALAFAVLSLTPSPTALGWVIASWTVPLVTLMLLGGVLSDRLPRTVVLRGTNLTQGAAQMLTAGLILTGHAALWHLCVLQFMAGCAAALGYPAIQSMVPVLVAPDSRKSAYLLLSQVRSILSILGPALAGLLTAILGPGWALLLDGCTYLAAAVLLAGVHLPQREDPVESTGVLAELGAGLRFAHSLGWVIPGAVLSLIYNAAISGGIGILGPVIAEQTPVGSTGWGLARAAEALGVFLFAFVLRGITLHRPLIACHSGFLLSALPLLALGLFSSTAPIATAMFAAGCGGALNELAWNLTIQEKIPEEMLSRIMSVDGFFSYLALPLGQLAVGPLSHAFGIRAVELGAAVLLVGTFGAAVSTPSIRHLTLTGPTVR